MLTLGVFSLGDTLESIFLNIFLALDSVIYGLICSAFRIFTAIAGARLLSSDVYTSIANKIYIIIGVVMLFVLAYAIIRAIIDPDQMTKGDLSAPKIIKNVVVAVIGLAIAPVLFNMMYQAQGLFLEHDVLVKLFFRTDQDNINLGSQSVGDTQVDIGTVYPNQEIDRVGGSVTAVSLWTAFFYPDVDAGATPDNIKANPADYYISFGVGVLCGVAAAAALIVGGFTFGLGTLLLGAAAGAVCAGVTTEIASSVDLGLGDEITLSQAYNVASTTGDFGLFSLFTSFAAEGQIKYTWFVSTIAGGFICYAFISFTIDMGVRAAKLAYYQIIAPIPLILQVLPKWKDTFSKYLREVINTFIEVFVRISVVYIIIYIICHLGDLFGNMGALFGNKNLNVFESTLAYALLIIGLVIFAKQAPKLISETFGLKSGSMSLGIGKKLAEGGVYTAGAAIGGGITAGVRNARARMKEADDKKGWRKTRAALSTIGGFGSGFVRSGWSAKGAKSFADMKKSAASGANAAVDARNKHDDKKKELNARAADNEEIRQLDNEIADANERLSNATTDAEKNAIKNEISKLNTKRNLLIGKGRVLARVSDGKDVIDRWSAGTYDTSKEDATMRFMGEMDGLKDKLREKTAKLDYVQRAINYEKDLNARQIERFDETAYKNAYDRYVANHAHASEAELSAERQRLRELYTMDEEEYKRKSYELSDLRTAAKKAREAAQDRGIVELASKEDPSVMGILTPFFQENSDFISKNSGQVFTFENFDGQEISRTLGQIISESFGNASLNGKFDPSQVFANQSSFQISEPTIVGADGNPLKITYSIDTSEGSTTKGKYVAVDDSGNKINVVSYTHTESDGRTSTRYRTEQVPDGAVSAESYDVDEFFGGKVLSVLENKGKVDSRTSTSVAGDIGKKIKTAIQNSDSYVQKVTRKRKAEESKK